MEFRLSNIKRLVEEYGRGDPFRFATDDKWLVNRYREHNVISGMHKCRYYRLFHKLSELYKPRFIVELGSYWATAAAHFAAGCPTADVVTIDVHKEVHPNDDVAWRKAQEAAGYYNNLHFIHGWTWDAHVIFEVCARPYPIDILYIDAGHKYDQVVREWDLYSWLLADEALVIADDVFDAAGATIDMMKFWDELDYEKFLDPHIHSGIPMGFLRFTR